MRALANITRAEGDPQVLAVGPSSLRIEDRLARLLGWTSLALGAAELIAARRIAWGLGLAGFAPVIRLFGARELASGVITLSTEKGFGLMTRIAGDALDMAVLAQGLTWWNPQRRRVRAALWVVGGITVLDCVVAAAVAARKARHGPYRTFADRSGFPQGIGRARGVAVNGDGSGYLTKQYTAGHAEESSAPYTRLRST